MKKITLLLCLSSALSFAQTIGLTSYATGLSSPVEIVNAGDDRLFVVQKGGAIRIITPSGNVGVVNATNFLNLSTIISTGSERGLLGLAFHPDYENNGFFYVNYTRESDGATVVARYSVSAGDPNIADPNSGQTIIVVDQPFANHNGGTLRFGPDGYLYIGMGDGGSGGDPGDRAQDINEDLGKMLRLDVDIPFPHFPATNPYAGAIPGNDGIWALGMRNPWKFSFNRLNGDLWIADVGQEEHEEVNKTSSPLPNTGLNYGWRCYEGNTPYNVSGCGPASNYTFPLIEYQQSTTGACSVTGGYYYTGSMYPNFMGKYIFGDYCLGKIMTLTDGGVLTFSPSITGLSAVTSFGEDINGELYVASSGNGVIYKIVDTSLGLSGFAENGFSMYPNPAESELFIRNSNETGLTQFSLYDLSGKLLMKQQLNDIEVNAISTGSIRSGLYLVTIEDKTGAQFSSKVAIK